MRFEAFTEEVSESLCEYNIGPMQKGCEQEVDAHDILRAASRLKPGQALIVMKKEDS